MKITKRDRIIWLVFGVGSILFSVWIFQLNKKEKVVEYYENGNIKAEYFTWQEMKHGKYLAYYENGEIKKKYNYYKDDLNGEIKEYYENGKLKFTYIYSHGSPDGLVALYFKTGKISNLGLYKNGIRIGEHEWYYENGQVRRMIDYDSSGIEKGHFDYTPDGKLDTLTQPFFLPYNVSKISSAEFLYSTRIFLGNRMKDSLTIKVGPVFVNDTVLISDIEEIKLTDFYGDYQLRSSKDGVYKFHLEIEEFDSLGLHRGLSFIYADTVYYDEISKVNY